MNELDLNKALADAFEAGFNTGRRSAEILPEQPAIKQSLTTEQPAQQEPFAWADLNALTEQFNSVNCGTAYRLPGEGRQPLYTRPQAREPLTDEQELRAFEAWCFSVGLMAESYGIRSESSHCCTAWEAWKARAAHGIKEDA